MNFDLAIEKTLAHEGGYVNDPADPGGETKFGISKRSYPDQDIRNLTRRQAIAIYRRDFWDKPGFDRIHDSGVAAKLFDMAVNMGTRRAVRLLQQAVNRFQRQDELLKVDGLLGSATANAVNRFRHADALLMALRVEAGNFYFNIDNLRFLAGWLRRLAA